MVFTWVSFIASLILMILIARKNLWVGLVSGALSLGLLNLSFSEVLNTILNTITDPATLLLAISVGVIPFIGGTLETSGLITDLVTSLKMKCKTLLMLAPAFMGMLPMPGGALLSAPLLSKIGKNIRNSDNATANVWFRHVLILIYPLGPLLATTKMAEINLYTTVLFLIPGSVLLTTLGYLFILRNVKDDSIPQGTVNRKKLIIPAVIIISAPAIHLCLMTGFKNLMQEIPLLVGVLFSLALVIHFGNLTIKDNIQLVKETRPWKFFLIIIGMFLFLNMFKASNTSKAISSIAFSRTFLIVVTGTFLGFVTGRVYIPISILLPTYYSRFGAAGMTPLVFSTMFFSVFIGYIISPIHPCVSVSLEYFKATLKDFYKRLAIPSIIAFLSALLFSILFIG